MREAAQKVTHGGRLLLVVYCRKGVHRSVSFGHVAWELLKASPTHVKLLPAYHASEHLWVMDYWQVQPVPGEVACPRGGLHQNDTCLALHEPV